MMTGHFKFCWYKNSALCVVLLWHILVLCSAAVVAEKVYFQDGENHLVAMYLLPTHSVDHKGIILFVHGDGSLDFEAAGYYPVIRDILCRQGFAIFSWSKPSVGGSSGQWLDQSMSDRQVEVRAAIKFVRSQYNYAGAHTVWLCDWHWPCDRVADSSSVSDQNATG